METEAAVAGALRAFLASPAACAALGAARPSRFSAQMLREDGEGGAEAASAALCTVSTVFYGLRGGASYAAQLAGVVCEWHVTRVDPVTRRTELESASLLPTVPISVTASGVISIDGSAGERVQRTPIALVDAFVLAAARHYTDERPYDPESELGGATRALVDALGGARGLLALIGHSQTVGSVAVAPLTRTQCVRSFQRRRSGREPLSVGARALAKHCQRVGGSEDGAASAWGLSELRGNDASKNARALEVLACLLDGAVWKNMHALPPFKEDSSVVTMEVRDSRGYGARWEIRDGAGEPESDDGAGYAFRGFLEPPMADGHDRRWRH